MDKKIGKLKIFLGYCAGVGKTYRMLQQGITAKENNINTLIGVVETHQRLETTALSTQLPILPRKKYIYGNLTLEELDLDQIINLKPQLVLIDELAHSNAPGARHAKRYQDIEELLQHGIDVYTTLNIQHIQELVDIVFQITQVRIHEIVPNSFFSLKAEIELVDLSPEKLQERLTAGKIYLPRLAKLAIKRFFRKGNLIALRELSLKYTAKLVDGDLLNYRSKEEVLEIWPVNSKLLLGITGHDRDEKLILATHRMAEELDAEWYVVHIENLPIEENYRNQLNHNITLAEELGGKVILQNGTQIARTIFNIAIEKNINSVIIGYSKYSGWKSIFKKSLLTSLTSYNPPFNIIAIAHNKNINSSAKLPFLPSQVDWRVCLINLLIIISLFMLTFYFSEYFTPQHLLLSLLFPLLTLGMLSGFLVSSFFTVAVLLTYDFFFLSPKYAFNLLNFNSFISMLIFLIINFASSWLGKIIRIRAENAKTREQFTYALFNFSRNLMGLNDPNSIIESAVKIISDAFDGVIILGLPNSNNQITIVAKSKNDLILDEKELAVATWVYLNGKNAGFTTNTLSSTPWFFAPLKNNHLTVGILGILIPTLNYEHKRLIKAFSNIIALALRKTK